MIVGILHVLYSDLKGTAVYVDKRLLYFKVYLDLKGLILRKIDALWAQ